MSGSFASTASKNLPKLNSDGINGNKFVVTSPNYNAGGAGTFAFFIADRPCVVLRAFANASVAATAQADFTVFKHSPTVSLSILNADISLNGTGQAVVVEGVLNSTLSRLYLDAGDTLVSTMNGAATTLAQGAISVQLQYLDF